MNADDFGRSGPINEAVIRAHREGILTTASLMVNEPACAEAVALARNNPGLGVGLHLALVSGRAALSPEQAPGLVNPDGQFAHSPVRAGFRYFFRRGLRDELRAEILAQFEKFRATGLVLDHVNAHLHLHLHPSVFAILMAECQSLGIRRMRLTGEPAAIGLRLSHGPWIYRLSHVLIFGWLARRARGTLARKGIVHTRSVFGLLQNGRVDEQYLLRLLAELPAGDSELYSHPSLGEFKHELDALLSLRVRELLSRRRVQLVRYQDLQV